MYKLTSIRAVKALSIAVTLLMIVSIAVPGGDVFVSKSANAQTDDSELSPTLKVEETPVEETTVKETTMKERAAPPPEVVTGDEDLSQKGQVQVHVYKFILDAMAVSTTTGRYAFPMSQTYSDGNDPKTNLYTLSPRTYEYSTVRMSTLANYSTHEVTNDMDSLSRVLPASATCSEGDFHCATDLNYDGMINEVDLCIIVNTWTGGETESLRQQYASTCFGQPIDGIYGDVNDDNIVNVNDLLLVINTWGECRYKFKLRGYTSGATFEDAANGIISSSTPSFEAMSADKHVIVWNKVCETGDSDPVNTPPVITLNGNNPMAVTLGSTFVDPGATATDVEDGDLTSAILVTGEVNVNTLGSNTLTYSVTDSGEITTSVTREVNVVADAVPPQPPTPPSSNSGASSSAGGSSRRVDISNLLATNVGGIGEVLGATTCGEFISSYIKAGGNNNPSEVMKLQSFLSEHLGIDLPLTGVYGSATRAAVDQFQLKHRGEVLKPWVDIGRHDDVNRPTAYVYKTTKRMINKIVCPNGNWPMPILP